MSELSSVTKSLKAAVDGGDMGKMSEGVSTLESFLECSSDEDDSDGKVTPTKKSCEVRGHRFVGYKLGRIEDTQAYFVLEEEDNESECLLPYMLVDFGSNEYHYPDETAFLMEFGSYGTFRLVWIKGAADIPELNAWFPNYSRWGIP